MALQGEELVVGVHSRTWRVVMEGHSLGEMEEEGRPFHSDTAKGFVYDTAA